MERPGEGMVTPGRGIDRGVPRRRSGVRDRAPTGRPGRTGRSSPYRRDEMSAGRAGRPDFLTKADGIETSESTAVASASHSARRLRVKPPREQIGETDGVLQIGEREFGFLRQAKRMYHPTPEDVFVPPGLIREFKLREGLRLAGPVGRGRNNGLELLRPETINGQSPEIYERVPQLEDLTPTDPDERLRFATGPEPLTTRVVDLVTPVGKGQRALIVAPPRTGKTVLLQHMAHGVSENHPEVVLKVLLVDERPEEVTDMKRTVRGEVVASSSDMNSDAHVRVAELVLEQARREVEFGHDVVIFLDSLTRLGRAYNRETGSSGRTLSGGIDARALERPKRIFGAARNIEHGGSLTIIATALIDTGSRMDEVIFQEFKGTGNMEMVLDRTIADMRIWPAVDVRVSGTRKEEKLYTKEELPRIQNLRRLIAPLDPLNAIQELLKNIDRWEGRDSGAPVRPGTGRVPSAL